VGGGVAMFLDTFRAVPDDSCGPCENPPCSSMLLAGDSGSAVLDLNNNIVGLLFAGDETGTFGLVATIQNVLSELNVSLDLLNCSGPPPPPPPPPPPISDQAPGDANNDGQINILDVTGILNDILEIAPAPGNGDCNNDGAVNILDVTCVLNIILEITPPPPPPPPPPPTCPSGEKDCPGVGCIPESATCCGDGVVCPFDFPLCTGTSSCCPGGFPFLCPDNIFCAIDSSSCPSCPPGFPFPCPDSIFCATDPLFCP